MECSSIWIFPVPWGLHSGNTIFNSTVTEAVLCSSHCILPRGAQFLLIPLLMIFLLIIWLRRCLQGFFNIKLLFLFLYLVSSIWKVCWNYMNDTFSIKLSIYLLVYISCLFYSLNNNSSLLMFLCSHCFKIWASRTSLRSLHSLLDKSPYSLSTSLLSGTRWSRLILYFVPESITLTRRPDFL